MASFAILDDLTPCSPLPSLEIEYTLFYLFNLYSQVHLLSAHRMSTVHPGVGLGCLYLEHVFYRVAHVSVLDAA